jgi:hypothetical protein
VNRDAAPFVESSPTSILGQTLLENRKINKAILSLGAKFPSTRLFGYPHPAESFLLANPAPTWESSQFSKMPPIGVCIIVLDSTYYL